MKVEQDRTTDFGEPVWELARLFPKQGDWSELDYLSLNTNHLVELSLGCLLFPPMPDLRHQAIVGHLLICANNHVNSRESGYILPAPLPLRLGQGEYREPDLLYLNAVRRSSITGDYPDGADLVMEVVMGDAEDRRWDYVDKRRDYAQAGIREYWIVDPDEAVILVLRLEGHEYVEHGRFGSGDIASSYTLPGFTVPVDEVWAAAHP